MANLLKNGKTLKQARDEILARTEKQGIIMVSKN